ncbi:phosphate ABC transporter permease subunit PstC [Salinisphaera aquimarina]|uniref:Phosphate transport system permease protein n=1 Tax=Salinisphaera aquimarina TaxID=2094031 RepID=A0ABV7EQG8_9GAMM
MQATGNPSQAPLGADDHRLKALGRNHRLDLAFKGTTFFFALLVLGTLFAIMASLLIAGYSTFSDLGLSFFTLNRWSANQAVFGALPAIYGTVVSSAIAILIATPISLGIAIFLTEKCPSRLRQPLATTVELLAGVPSIIYGMWGVQVLAPFLQSHFPQILPAGTGLFTAGLILAIMIVPFITSVTRDVLMTVPTHIRESAYGVGCTTWEVVRYIMLPSVKGGVVGAIILGLGRALGETMAVTFVIGNNLFFAPTLFGQGTSIAALIANQFPEADGAQRSALLALGLVLFIITFAVLAVARVMLSRMDRRNA